MACVLSVMFLRFVAIALLLGHSLAQTLADNGCVFLEVTTGSTASFKLLLLQDIGNYRSMYITNTGLMADGTFSNTAEGGIGWMMLSGATAGTVVSWEFGTSDTAFFALSGPTFQPKTGGDQLYAYATTSTGPIGNTVTTTHFGCAITTKASWDAESTDQSTGTVPSVLTGSASALAIGGADSNAAGYWDHAWFMGTRSGDDAEIRAFVQDFDNWNFSTDYPGTGNAGDPASWTLVTTTVTETATSSTSTSATATVTSSTVSSVTTTSCLHAMVWGFV